MSFLYRLVFISSALEEMCMHAQLLQSCLSVCNPMDESPLRSSVYEILQARILEWVAISSPRGSSQPEVQSVSFITPELAGKFLITHATWEVPVCVFIYIYINIYIILIPFQFFYFSWVTTCMYFFSNTNVKMQNPHFCILLFDFNLSKYSGDCSKPYIYITF